MGRLDISLIGHGVTTLSFLGVAVYAFVHERELQRTTRNSSFLFYTTVGVSIVFALLNIFRFIYEISGGPATPLTNDADLIAQYSGILIESVLILILFTNKIIVFPTRRSGQVVAIGAHPDDIEIAAGAALSKMRDAGYRVSGLVMTQGERGGNGHIRPEEARQGANFLGLDEVEVLDFPDTRLSMSIVEVTNAIEAIIQKEKPDIIFTHSMHDLHQDHQAVYEATLRAARNTRTTILCYESPSVTQDFHPTYFVDVGKYVEIKLRAMHEHWDQRQKPYMKADLVRGTLAFRGAQAKVDYAEGFEVARMVSAI
jgi:LmbE family N-acetylglucosaminyl deacetylase